MLSTTMLVFVFSQLHLLWPKRRLWKPFYNN